MLAKQHYCTCSKMTDWDSMCQLYIQVSWCYSHIHAKCKRRHLWSVTFGLPDFSDLFIIISFLSSSLGRADNCWHDFHNLRSWRPRTRYVCVAYSNVFGLYWSRYVILKLQYQFVPLLQMKVPILLILLLKKKGRPVPYITVKSVNAECVTDWSVKLKMFVFRLFIQPEECGKTTSRPSMALCSLWIVQT